MIVGISKIYSELLNKRKHCDSPEGFLLYLRQLSAYRYVSSFCTSRTILEIGPNIGYGTRIIINNTWYYVGLDIAFNDLLLAKHVASTGTFLCGDSSFLPFNNDAFDSVIAFQVIEHVNEMPFLLEIRRVLKPGGKLFLSTPNRKWRLLPFQKPWNCEHMREYSLNSLKKVISGVFDSYKIFGLQVPPEILSIERNRVRQNPIKVYCEVLKIPHIVGTFLSYFFDKPIFPPNLPINVDYYVEKYSLKDFIFSNNNVKIGLDFLAVCEK